MWIFPQLVNPYLTHTAVWGGSCLPSSVFMVIRNAGEITAEEKLVSNSFFFLSLAGFRDKNYDLKRLDR